MTRFHNHEITIHEYAVIDTSIEIEHWFFLSSIGYVLAAFIDDKLCNLFLGEREDKDYLIGELKKDWPSASFIEKQSKMALQVQQALSGSHHVKLDVLLKGTAFQLTVWKALLQIPPYHLVSYEEIALRIGNKNKVRAVATAIGKNRVSFFIPCHLVIYKDGNIGQYRWGSDKKAELIAVDQGALQSRSI
ncbi:MAG: methylated-DNA--[protein]-cysteine S-methyltransferase [Chlamydiales bacterium]|nr:methylated-DNA--[protein]-cysteine S-methyltransferase [Chlamydiales bacterium]